MSLAVKGLQNYKLIPSSEKARLHFVRFVSSLLMRFSLLNPMPQAQRSSLMTEPYKKLEELARKHALAQTRVQRSAFAIIAVGETASRRYLLQWNANWSMFNLIGGKVDNSKGDADSFRRTIAREIEEELGIICPEECRIGQELGQIQMEQFSHREERNKKYHFVLFEAQILPDLPMANDPPHYFARWLSTGRENIFVSPLEIQNLTTSCGRPISATTRHILQVLGEIPTHPVKREKSG